MSDHTAAMLLAVALLFGAPLVVVAGVSFVTGVRMLFRPPPYFPPPHAPDSEESRKTVEAFLVSRRPQRERRSDPRRI